MTSTAVQPTTSEKLVGTLLVLLLMAIGWGPFLLRAWELPFLERPLLFATLAAAVLSLGLVYDAAERILGIGRGVYAAAVFCSLPATGMIASEPGSLAVAGAMLVTALGIWLASRATGEEWPYFAAMLSALLLFSGYMFGFFPGTLGILFAAGLAARKARKARALSFWLMILAHVAGALSRFQFNVGVPTLETVTPGEAETPALLVLPWLPWILFVVPAVWLLAIRRSEIPRWWLDASAALVLVIVSITVLPTGMSAAAAGSAALLALLAADVQFADFAASQAREVSAVRLPVALIAALVLLAVPVASSSQIAGIPVVRLPVAAVFVFAATGLVWTTLHRLPLWSFAFLVASAILFGRILDTRVPILTLEEPVGFEASVGLPALALLIGGASVLALVLHFVLRSRLRPRLRS
ncbi:hypothetical protein KKH27_10495 [bacterium]|nr:hypothetical protein [bacterium]MBU1984592.1 hypothetical protein [bacterium]